MKKRWFFTCLVLAGILGATCISCDNNAEEADWRDANIAFMSKIAKKTGIHTIGDTLNGYPGIYYEVIESGNPNTATPMIGDVVTVDYTGWLYNSTDAFDSREDFTQELGNGVISGWTLALEQMRVGDTWKVYIPYYLGYGISKYDEVPAYSALTFTIKLKKITTSR